MRANRVFLIVLDSFGVGELPDAAAFGDKGSHTLRSCFLQPGFSVPCERRGTADKQARFVILFLQQLISP